MSRLAGIFFLIPALLKGGATNTLISADLRGEHVAQTAGLGGGGGQLGLDNGLIMNACGCLSQPAEMSLLNESFFKTGSVNPPQQQWEKGRNS